MGSFLLVEEGCYEWEVGSWKREVVCGALGMIFSQRRKGG